MSENRNGIGRKELLENRYVIAWESLKIAKGSLKNFKGKHLLGNGYQLVENPEGIVQESLRNPYRVVREDLKNCSGIDKKSLRNRYEIATES